MPESQREVQALLALSQAEPPRRVRRLLDYFGSAQEALRRRKLDCGRGSQRARAASDAGRLRLGRRAVATALCGRRALPIPRRRGLSPTAGPNRRAAALCCLRWGRTI